MRIADIHDEALTCAPEQLNQTFCTRSLVYVCLQVDLLFTEPNQTFFQLLMMHHPRFRAEACFLPQVTITMLSFNQETTE